MRRGDLLLNASDIELHRIGAIDFTWGALPRKRILDCEVSLKLIPAQSVDHKING